MATRILTISANGEDPALGALPVNLGGAAIVAAVGVLQGLEYLKASDYDALVVCCPIPEWSATEILEEIQRINPLVPLICLMRNANPEQAVRLARLGAFQVHDLETPSSKLAQTVQEAAAWRGRQRLGRNRDVPVSEAWRRLLIGDSRAMRNVMEVVELIGGRKSTVLITGETGTGKELVARAIHLAGPRARRPMVCVNCSALPENLLEAELFGHVKGAFTGAVGNRVGRFEQAHGSTIFLDEIGDMPLELQAKLLRVLQERTFQRLGSSETIRVDIRVIAATNADLAEKMRRREFREDLYYRLNVVPLAMPPLRERSSDIPALAHHFVEKICRQEDLPPRQLSPETVDRLTSCHWPGNVRQLENAVEMAIALSGDRTVLYPSDFPLPSILDAKPVRTTMAPVVAVPDDGLDYDETVGRIERAILEQAMQKTGGNKKQAAEMLRLKRTTFAAKLKSLGAAINEASRTAAVPY